MEESLAAYRRGEVNAAVTLALSAYLDGFELAENSLRLLDEPLVQRIELAMVDYRNALKANVAYAQAEAAARDVTDALDKARARLSEDALSPWAAFLASFVILLREGLEAVLVVTALAAFLRRSGQGHAMPYLHAGWLAALALGAITWFLATRLTEASGASREITEGITGLVAAAMLLYVGFWLHDKSHAQAWQRYLMGRARAIGPGAAWGIALTAFLAVYREVFETVLFYQALWSQAPGREAAILGGLGAALAALAAVTWAMLRMSLRLPLGLFFGASGILLAALAVVLAGNGVAALQEAGVVPVTPVAFFNVGWLGIHANAQSLAAQAVLAVLTIVILLRSRKR
jgi:high-affinity iron transporter